MLRSLRVENYSDFRFPALLRVSTQYVGIRVGIGRALSEDNLG